MKRTSITLCLWLALAVGTSTGHAQVTDTLPLQSRIRVGLTERVPLPGGRGLSLWLVTEDSFPDTGYALATVVTRSAGRRRIEILGAYKSPGFAGMMVSPASFGEPLDLYVGRAPDTIAIAYQQDVDRYLVWRTTTHAFIRSINSSFTVLPADSLELAVPGIVMVACSPAGYPKEDCEEFLSGLLPIGTRTELLDPAEDPATRVFGSTFYADSAGTNHNPGLRALVVRGVVEAEIQRVIAQALAFLRARAGQAPPWVTVRTWDGRFITCSRGACRGY